MFVKVERIKEGSESLFQCDTTFWTKVKEDGKEVDMLILESDKDCKTLLFDASEEQYHVFTMNDSGKTIDAHYISN